MSGRVITLPYLPNGTPAPIVEKKKEITLISHQEAHYERVQLILQSGLVCVDLSSMGRGKTYIAAKIVSPPEYDMNYLVICPVDEPWRKINREYDMGSNFKGAMTYASLTGKTKVKSIGPGSIIRHEVADGYLWRIDGMSMDGKPYSYFEVTDKFKSSVNNPNKGFMLILDEAHSLKNKDSLRTRAISTMSGYIRESKHKNARMMLLSATYFDLPEHAESFCRILGLITQTDLVRSVVVGSSEKSYTGLAEMVGICAGISKKRTDDIINEFEKDLIEENKSTKSGVPITMRNLDVKSAQEIVFRLYIGIIHPRFSSEMPDNLPKRNYRAFINISNRADKNKYVAAAKKFREATGYDEDTGDISLAGTLAMQAVKAALAEMEISMCYDTVRFISDGIKANPNRARGAIYLNFIASVEYASVAARTFGHPVMIITGELVKKQTDRVAMRDRFMSMQAENGGLPPILIMTIATGGLSFSLHDIVGGNVILSAGAPGWSAVLTHQSSGRSNRSGQLSLPFFFLVFANYRESEIVNKIFRKMELRGKTIMATRIETKDDVSQMPGNYPRFYEGLGYVDEENLSNADMKSAGFFVDKSPDWAAKSGARFHLPINASSLALISGISDSRDEKGNSPLTEYIRDIKNMDARVPIDNVHAIIDDIYLRSSVRLWGYNQGLAEDRNIQLTPATPFTPTPAPNPFADLMQLTQPASPASGTLGLPSPSGLGAVLPFSF